MTRVRSDVICHEMKIPHHGPTFCITLSSRYFVFVIVFDNACQSAVGQIFVIGTI